LKVLTYSQVFSGLRGWNVLERAQNAGTFGTSERCNPGVTRARRGSNVQIDPLATTRAPIFIAIVVATFAGALAVLLPGMPDVKAGLQTKAAPVSQARPKADRLPIFAFDVLRSASERPPLERLG
jgi:hypothetical protein